MSEPEAPERKRGKFGIGSWILAIAMVAMLLAAIWFGVYGWTLTDAKVSTNGYVALTLGVVFSLVVGIGLMALVFYSNRKGYDR